jgi:hypothetical protein
VTPDRSARYISSRHAAAVVLIAAVVLVLAGGGPPSHRHEAAGPALYDEQCVLASLDSFNVDTVLPVGGPTTGPTELTGWASAPRADACPSPVPAAGSRSPPAS